MSNKAAVPLNVSTRLEEFHIAFKARVVLPSRSPLHQLLSTGTLLFLRFDMVTNVGVRMRKAMARLRWHSAPGVLSASAIRPYTYSFYMDV